MLTTLKPLVPNTPPLFSHGESRGEGVCVRCRGGDRSRGGLHTVLDHGERLDGAVQRHASLLHLVPVDDTEHLDEFSPK